MKAKSSSRHHGPVAKPRVPDAIILEMRRLHEIERWPMLKVFRKFPQYSEDWLRRVLVGDERPHLRVKPLR